MGKNSKMQILRKGDSLTYIYSRIPKTYKQEIRIHTGIENREIDFFS